MDMCIARNQQEKYRKYSPVYVQEANTSYLDDVCVLNLGRLVRELDISCENVKYEYLILYNIRDKIWKAIPLLPFWTNEERQIHR